MSKRFSGGFLPNPETGASLCQLFFVSAFGYHANKYLNRANMILKDLLIDYPQEIFSTPVALTRFEAEHSEYESPMHRHKTGQFVVTLHGSVTCRTEEGIWLVPPQCAIWIAPDTRHCNRVSASSSVCMLFVEADEVRFPETCCTFAITPLVAELFKRIASLSETESTATHARHLYQVLLEELSLMPQSGLRLPIPGDPRLKAIAQAIIDDPSGRKTISGWAKFAKMSRRSLERLVTEETGTSFGRWRQQLLLIMAIQQLTEGATVQQTAWDMGYESVTAFITMFKKALGIPPAKYVIKKGNG